jgi:hypothetical protein
MSLNSTNLYIQGSPLPPTFRGTPNDLFSEMVKRMRILSPSGTNFIFIGDTEPTSNVGPWLKNGNQWYVWDESTKRYVPQNISASFTAPYWTGFSTPASANPNLWLRTTQDPTSTDPGAYGAPIQWYLWNGSAWVWPHQVVANASERRLWVGSESELWAYDGGDGGNPASVTDITGPMWIVDVAFNQRTARGALPGTLEPGAQAGADSSVQPLPSYLPAHFHNESVRVKNTNSVHNWGNGQPAEAGNVEHLSAGGPDTGTVTTTTDTQGGGTPPNLTVPTIPASIGTYFIKRSARKFYTPQ